MKTPKISPPGLRKQVGIWIRVSTEDQAKGDSPELHEKRARYYAESQNWEVVEVYHLEGVSGKTVSAHPEAVRMLKDVRSGRITGLIFTKLARLARNTRELLDFAEEFRKRNANLTSLEEKFDTSTAAGMLFFTLVAAMAQWEREEIASRIVSSINMRAKLGKPLNGTPPFGYQWKDKQLVVDPEEAPIRKLIYELFAEHKRLKTVASLLNDRGLRTRRGKEWTDTTIRYLLLDPTAKGEHRALFTHRPPERKGGFIIKPREEWVTRPCEAIVTPELWERCHDLIEERKHQMKPGPKPIHLFSGLLFCHCGRKMYVRSETPHKYLCFTCRNKIEKATLEQAYVDWLKGYFLSPEQIAENLRLSNDQLVEKEKLLHALEKEIAKVRSEIDRVYRLYQDENIDGKAFGNLYKPLNERLEQLNDELPKLQATVDYQQIKELSVEAVLDEARTLYDLWPKLEPEDKRRVVESLTEKIIVGKDEIEITLTAAIASENMVKKQSQLALIVEPPMAAFSNGSSNLQRTPLTKAVEVKPWPRMGRGLQPASASLG
ncbi:MAG: recombinase family protein [Verrucomicrobiota bacterium]